MEDELTLQSLLQRVEQLTADVEALQQQLRQQPALETFNTFNESPNDRDILSLNVGGTPIQVLRGTLTAVPGILASRFSGEWDKNLLQDHQGRFYLEEDSELFGELIHYLREHNRMLSLDCQRLEAPHFRDQTKQQRFYRMIESFLMTNSLYPMELWSHGTTRHQSVLAPIAGDLYDIPQVDQHGGGGDDDGDIIHYALRAKGSHQRRVESFELHIKPGDGCKKLVLGWTDLNFHHTTHYRPGHLSAPGTSTISLDLLKSTVVVELQDRIETASFESSGSIYVPGGDCLHIRCGKFGAEWSVDGEPLNIPMHVQKLTDLVTEIKRGTSLLPFLAIQGSCSFQITKVELEL